MQDALPDTGEFDPAIQGAIGFGIVLNQFLTFAIELDDQTVSGNSMVVCQKRFDRLGPFFRQGQVVFFRANIVSMAENHDNGTL